MKNSGLISLCGAPGSGKTTIARKLAEKFGAELIEEDYSGNPFLAESYKGCNELRLPGQTWFLLSRVNQLAKQNFCGGPVISDYAYFQDKIYAELLLAADELAAYRAIAGRVGSLVVQPELVIMLDGSTELLLDRVANRGRDYESVFDGEFLQSLSAACRAEAANCGAAVINVDIDSRDLLKADDFDWLCEEIKNAAL